MKLDPSIIEGKKPLSCFDTEEAKQFEGKEGYFANSIDEFCDLNDVIDGKLFDVDDSTNIPFDCIDAVSDNYYYSFFLPKEWVKESKWRAFKDHDEYKEFLNDGIIESWVKIKDKNADKIYELMYVGGGDDKICLGGMMFLVSTLFNTFELFNESTGEWRPFGVEVKE